MLTPEQAAERARNIGASEVAALFDLHPHLTKWELWMRKAGRLPQPETASEWAVWGNVLEPAIARGIATDQGWLLRKVRRYHQHPNVQGMGASLDFEVWGEDGVAGVLEIKNVDRFIFARWPDGEPPLHFELQLQHQMACAPRKRLGFLGMLVGGNTPVVKRYARHPAAIAKLEAAVTAFWQSVAADRPPEPDFERDCTMISLLYSHAEPGLTRDLRGDRQFEALCAEYLEASAAMSAAGSLKQACKAKILDIIREAEVAVGNEFKVSAPAVPPGRVEAYDRAGYRAFLVRPLNPKPRTGDANGRS
jgi:putative phage-type endonuclease